MDYLSLRKLELENYPVVGLDEVGRGALFGVVVAAAVILPPQQLDRLEKAGVTDSKRLTAKSREKLDLLIRSVAVDCQIGVATVGEILELNILEASLLAMERSLSLIKIQPNLCLVDGNQLIRFKLIPAIPQIAVIKGDSLSLSIAAASIVAKVWRDRLITDLANTYLGYDLAQNKGYGTAKHLAAIQSLGLTDLHRSSFKIKF